MILVRTVHPALTSTSILSSVCAEMNTSELIVDKVNIDFSFDYIFPRYT